MARSGVPHNEVALERNRILLKHLGACDLRILTDLNGEVDQRNDDREATDEVAEISESFEDLRLPTSLLRAFNPEGSSLRSMVAGGGSGSAAPHRAAKSAAARNSVAGANPPRL